MRDEGEVEVAEAELANSERCLGKTVEEDSDGVLGLERITESVVET